MSSQPLHPPPSAPTLLPSPLSNPSTTDPSSSSNNNNNKDQYHPPSPPTPPHPPTFQPFFTLLSTPTTPTTHHPTTHYIFSDDAPDHDPITSAALLVLQHQQPSHPTSPSSPRSSPRDGTAGRGSESVGGGKVRERYVLLDMDGTGTRVECARSMVSDWAVTGTEVGMAPTWDREGGEGREGQGLMLRIEGMEVGGEEGGELRGEGKRLEELVEVYERQMAELRRVVDAGQGIGMGGGDGR